jgi:hypothetical protein
MPANEYRVPAGSIASAQGLRIRWMDGTRWGSWAEGGYHWGSRPVWGISSDCGMPLESYRMNE